MLRDRSGLLCFYLGESLFSSKWKINPHAVKNSLFPDFRAFCCRSFIWRISNANHKWSGQTLISTAWEDLYLSLNSSSIEHIRNKRNPFMRNRYLLDLRPRKKQKRVWYMAVVPNSWSLGFYLCCAMFIFPQSCNFKKVCQTSMLCHEGIALLINPQIRGVLCHFLSTNLDTVACKYTRICT